MRYAPVRIIIKVTFLPVCFHEFADAIVIIQKNGQNDKITCGFGVKNTYGSLDGTLENKFETIRIRIFAVFRTR